MILNSDKLKRLAIITSHPIQYNAPLFKLLTQRNKNDVKVFYTWGEKVLDNKYDPGFGKTVKWDIPLLDGYDYEFVENISKAPGSHHFKGIDNPKLLKKIEKWNPDVLLVFGWSYKSHLKVLRYFKGKKRVLFRGDSTLLDEQSGFNLKKIFRKYFLTWVYRHIDTALYAGTANKNYFIKFGLQERQLLFVPHAVENERFGQKKSLKENFREKLKISQDAIVFLFAGKLEAKKNPVLMLNAFCALSNKNAHLIFAGNGILENQLIKKFSKYSNIHFISFQNQSLMPSLYNSADIFVLPSKGPSETWGLSVNEAMACSKPVLVSDKCGCAADLVKNGVNGYIFQSGNKEDLEDKILLLGGDKNKLREMGAQSLKIISEWNFDKAAAGIERAVQLM